MNKNLLKYILIGLAIIVLIIGGRVIYLISIRGRCEAVDPIDCSPLTTPKESSNASNLPTTCTDEQEGIPVITSLSFYSGSIGAEIQINGCNFAGFEGDKNAWIEDSTGVKGILYGEKDSTDKTIKIILKSPVCQEDLSYKGGDCTKFLPLNPGTYKIYVYPWGKESNKVDFIIK